MSVTLIIIIATLAVSLMAFNDRNLFFKLQFNAYLIHSRKEWHRFFTYGFIHADTLHLLVNLYVLYTFGKATEEIYEYVLGPKGIAFYVLLYVSSIFSSVVYSYEKHKHDLYYNAVGASGAVSAVVFATILFNPTMKLYLFFIPVGIPAFVFGLLYLAYSYYMSNRAQDNVGHDAHFFGALYGVIFTLLIDRGIGAHFVEQIRYTYFE